MISSGKGINKMDLHSAVKIVADKFQYKADKNLILDGWSIMRDRSGVYQGDCEDFALTVFWHLSEQNLFKFLLNLIVLHKYKLIWCKTHDGELHFVGRYGDLYFDNWTKKALTEHKFFATTGHRKIMTMFMPVCIPQLLKGIFKR